MHDKPLLKCSLDSLDGVPNSLRSSVFSDWPIKRLDAGYDVYLSQSYGTLSVLSRQITIFFKLVSNHAFREREWIESNGGHEPA